MPMLPLGSIRNLVFVPKKELSAISNAPLNPEAIFTPTAKVFVAPPTKENCGLAPDALTSINDPVEPTFLSNLAIWVPLPPPRTKRPAPVAAVSSI